MDDRLSELAEEVARLRQRVEELEQRAGAPPPREQPIVQAAPPPTPAPTPVPIVTPPPPPPPTAPPRIRPQRDLEAEVGGNWLNKIGAVALVLGVAFFLKYAFDNRWIGPTGRIIIGVFAGLICLYLGEYFQKRRLPRYAQGISGAGIAILYFTIFAAFSFYYLISQTAAFAIMIVITIAAIAVSVRRDAIAIAILGIIGGFMTPVLIQSPGDGGASNQVPLFTYIAILDLGILGITYYKNWRALNVLSLAGTFLIVAGWTDENYQPTMLGIMMSYLTVFYLIFAAQSFVQNVITRRPVNAADLLMAISSPVLYFATAYSLLAAKYHPYLGGFAVLMVVVYILMARGITVSAFEDRYLRLLYLAIASGFLIIAVPIQLKGPWITIGWAGEAAVLAWIGFYMESARTRYIAFGLLGISVLYLLGGGASVRGTAFTPFLNQRFGTFLFVIAMAVLMAILYYAYRRVVSDGEKPLQVMLVLGANILMIWVLSAEVRDWIRSSYVGRPGYEYYAYGSATSLALSAVWAIYGVLMLIAGIVWRYRPARLTAIIILGVVILKSFFYDVWSLERLYRIIAFVGLGILLLVASYVYQAYRDRIREFVSGGGGNE